MRIRKNFFGSISFLTSSSMSLYPSINICSRLFVSFFVQTEISQKRSLSVSPFLSFFHCLFVSLCLSIYIYPSMYVSISLFLCIYLFMYVCMYVCMYPSIYQYLSMSPSISITFPASSLYCHIILLYSI